MRTHLLLLLLVHSSISLAYEEVVPGPPGNRSLKKKKMKSKGVASTTADSKLKSKSGGKGAGAGKSLKGGSKGSKGGKGGCSLIIVNILAKDLGSGSITDASSGEFRNSNGKPSGIFIESIVATNSDCIISGGFKFTKNSDQIFYTGTCSSDGDLLTVGGTGVYEDLAGKTVKQKLSPDEESVDFIINPC
jgi:hypothetical protein